MNVPFVLRGASVLVCVLAATSGWSQDLPAIPLRIDPAFWGHANKPYTLKLTVTTTSVDGSNGPQTVVTEQNVSRDSAGRESTEGFYDSGQPRSVWVRDPGKGTLTMMQVVGKLAWVHPMPPPALPLNGHLWTVEQLPSRVIEGFSVEGFRFTSTVPASDDGKRAADTVIEEEWVSNELDVLLEQKIQSQLSGTTTKTVSHFEQVEPDPTHFEIPSDFTLQQNAVSVSP